MVKALFVIWSLERGGAERFLASLLKNIDRNKIEPVVCCLNWKGEWAYEIEEKGTKVIELNKKNGLDLGAFIKLVKIIKEGEFDIINTHLWGADVMGRIAAILAGVPVIVSTVQNVDIWKRWWHIAIDRVLSCRTDMFIAVSDAVKDYCHKTIGIPLSKITVIPNAIELERFQEDGDIAYLYDELKLTRGDFILSCIGRLTHQKGQRYLLEAVSLLKEDCSDLRVVFAGDGEDKKMLIDLAKKRGVSHMVRFLGQREDIPQILHLSKGVVLPSLYEGLPVCLLEAMAAGKPVVATSVGGTPELIIDNQTGFIVLPKDVDALALAIKNLVNLPDRGKSIGEKAKREVENRFSIKSISEHTTKLFMSLAGDKQCVS